MSAPRGPMLLFDTRPNGGIEAWKSLEQIDTQYTADPLVGLRIVDVAGHLWVVDSCEDLGFAGAWSLRDLFRFRPRRIKLHAVDRGEITQAEVQAMIAEIWKRPNVREYLSEIGLDHAPSIAARAPNVAKLVARFYSRLK